MQLPQTPLVLARLLISLPHALQPARLELLVLGLSQFLDQVRAATQLDSPTDIANDVLALVEQFDGPL